MRWNGVGAVLLVAAAACGTGPTGATGSTDESPAPGTTTPLPKVPSTTASETDGLDAALVDRSVLSLGLDGETSGSFRVQPGGTADFVMPVAGSYWVTSSGNVYTRLDVDPQVIADGMSLLVDRILGTGEGGPNYQDSLQGHYRGDEFQIGVTDLVRWIGVGPLPLEWVEQWSWFAETDPDDADEEFLALLTRCRAAVESFDAAARDWVKDLAVDFESSGDAGLTWQFPVSDLADALAGQQTAAAVCEEFIGEEPGALAELSFTVSPESNGRRIDIYADPKIYTDHGPQLILSLVMTPGTVGDPPHSPSPTQLLTLRGTFLTAIGICGELPWIYSNFAAADSYYAATSDGYPGPTIFASDWLCSHEVPEERRRDRP